MSNVNLISVISIPVTDQERALSFYRDGLGFEVIADNEFAPGQRWLQLAPPGAQTTISLTTWLDDFPPGSVRGNILEVEDIAAAKAGMSARGVEFPEQDTKTPWGTFAAFADPDGNRWSLNQPSADVKR